MQRYQIGSKANQIVKAREYKVSCWADSKGDSYRTNLDKRTHRCIQERWSLSEKSLKLDRHA